MDTLQDTFHQSIYIYILSVGLASNGYKSKPPEMYSWVGSPHPVEMVNTNLVAGKLMPGGSEVAKL